MYYVTIALAYAAGFASCFIAKVIFKLLKPKEKSYTSSGLWLLQEKPFKNYESSLKTDETIVKKSSYRL